MQTREGYKYNGHTKAECEDGKLCGGYVLELSLIIVLFRFAEIIDGAGGQRRVRQQMSVLGQLLM